MIAQPLVKEEKKQDVQRLYTLEEYFELEEKSLYKNEFHNGRIIPLHQEKNDNEEMAGGTFNHNILSSTIHGLLFMLLFHFEEEATVLNSDQNIYLEELDRSVYPDVCIVKDTPKMKEQGKYGLTNPTVIIEVLSKSTEKQDRSGKFRMYQTLPSFKEYVLVDQNTPVVEVFLKIEENKWQMSSYVGLDKVVKLDTLDVELKMSDIYKKTKDLKDPQFAIDFPE